MKKIFILFIFKLSLIQCMQTDNPRDVIKKNITNPASLLKELQKFPKAELVKFRDHKYNNLIHLVVQELYNNKDNAKFDLMLEQSKPVVRYLANIGVRLNELNDDQQTPIMISYSHKGTYDFGDNFLESIGAHPTYFSLEPELRKMKKNLKYVLCCECLKDKQD